MEYMYSVRNVSSQPTSQLRVVVGANLKAAAEAKGLTQRQVADAVGATPAQVSKWMKGAHEPRAYLFQLAELLTDGDVSAFYREPEDIAA